VFYGYSNLECVHFNVIGLTPISRLVYEMGKFGSNQVFLPGLPDRRIWAQQLHSIEHCVHMAYRGIAYNFFFSCSPLLENQVPQTTSLRVAVSRVNAWVVVEYAASTEESTYATCDSLI